MFIIKQTDTNIVLDSSDTIEYQSNNYPVVRPGTDYALAYYPGGIEVVEVEISDELLEQIKNDTVIEVQQEVNTNAD